VKRWDRHMQNEESIQYFSVHCYKRLLVSASRHWDDSLIGYRRNGLICLWLI
jgi:hypothetical protein